ncbi:hypothetical protein GCK72_023126 [Caenorhabditis remanei]|uniref:Uncharacterized protein n=1 Tax=Caenorhabditis remanei TaxID=31234 RepID=A0A6A5FW83_CAERE|nr:hypothetical protein GCK72_023126 [Caenorhabditis remanei]KAF1746669.1 hypothetical protein GCK72_023126 [Caenorhabditis remanei]
MSVAIQMDEERDNWLNFVAKGNKILKLANHIEKETKNRMNRMEICVIYIDLLDEKDEKLHYIDKDSMMMTGNRRFSLRQRMFVGSIESETGSKFNHSNQGIDVNLPLCCDIEKINALEIVRDYMLPCGSDQHTRTQVFIQKLSHLEEENAILGIARQAINSMRNVVASIFSW